MNFPGNIWPQIILAGSTILILLVLALKRNHLLTNILTSLAFAAALVSSFMIPLNDKTGLFFTSGFGVFILIVLISTAFIITVFSFSYLDKHPVKREEFYILLLTGTLGATSLAVSSNFVSFFISLELLSVSVFIMAGYLHEQKNAAEASIKYLILSGVSSAFLLFGMALVFLVAGSLDFGDISRSLIQISQPGFIVLTGLGFLIIGTGFKMGVVPFHLWTPDVYEGAPAITTAFIATVSKGAIVAVWLRFFTEINGYRYETVVLIISVIAAVSILTGNLLALMQKNIKRLLAYSSIANLGYILIAFVSGGIRGDEAVAFYLVSYIAAVTGAFGIIAFFSSKERDAERITDFSGLFWQRPWMAVIFSAVLLSLAGLPLTVGFIGKFYVAFAGITSGNIVLVVILVIGSAIGLFYYLRIIVEMMKKQEEKRIKAAQPLFNKNSLILLSLLFLFIVWTGIFPAQMIRFIQLLLHSV